MAIKARPIPAGFTAEDRCQSPWGRTRCPAQGCIRISVHGIELVYCGHHGRERRDALPPEDVEVLAGADEFYDDFDADRARFPGLEGDLTHAEH